MIEKLLPDIENVVAYQRTLSNADLATKSKAYAQDYVTEVDMVSQKMIVEGIDRCFPGSGILSEEEGDDRLPVNGTPLFIIDPLDGTANYVNRMGYWGLSVALVKDGQITEGIIANGYDNNIICSLSAKPMQTAGGGMESMQFYAIDSGFESSRFLWTNAKRRQFGATVPACLFCCTPGANNAPSLDAVLIGSSSIWDIAGAVAVLNAIGGVALDSEGRDMAVVDIFDTYGDIWSLKQKRFQAILSASPSLAREIVATGVLGIRS